MQIDSVNVLVRAHYMPLFSRLGAYDRALLDRVSIERPRRFFEYWGHEASLLPVDCHALLRWRMERALRGEGIWRQLEPFATERRGEADALLARIAAEGALAASDLAGAVARKGMWVWSEAKHALEWLFWAGLVAATHRRGSFERVYDLPERVLPRAILDAPTPSPVDAQRELLARAALALGVATSGDLRDYYRIPASDVALPLAQLVEEGTISPVQVRGWRQQAYLHRDAVAGRRIGGSALLSPFDPLIWRRERTERLFDFRYRLEIYTPAHKREHGYYVLPFLLDDAIVARADLKADRKSGCLVVQQASIESAAPRDTIDALRTELQLMADWLGLPSLSAAPLDALHGAVS
ncbi:winged helix-turn-helix domain-containing protein [Sphingomonas nostoxanthinifaciens]|uniref:winged helix-turn-helix domain-containing protein n=1 Tax=Sphingomonas nostoxanthinifaciens TaxID=2872652 RepID=UPI0021DB2173|nr:crosslink repair DNA glycosylase YcaQ family protein [Sphingomonas nostoxanthinifaciens]